MRKPNPTQQIFEARFLETAKQHVSMGRYERGFLTEVTKSLGFRNTSVVTRWLEGYMPSGRNLVTIHQKWHVSADYLLGIE